MTCYSDALVNETNTIPLSTILTILLSQSTYLLFIFQLYEHEGPEKLLRLNVNCCLKYACQQIISLKVSCIRIVYKS